MVSSQKTVTAKNDTLYKNMKATVHSYEDDTNIFNILLLEFCKEIHTLE